MIKGLIVGTSLSVLPLVAMAADLPSKVVAPTPPPVIMSSWDGFYLGASVAHSVGNVGVKVEDALELSGFGSSGYSAGALVGYNYTFRDTWLMGVELAGEFTTNAARARIGVPSPGVNAKLSSDRDVTLSGRLGYLVSPNTLVYTSIGATQVRGRGNFGLTLGPISPSTSYHEDFRGVALGFGIESQLSGGWRGRFEYVSNFLNSKVYNDGLKVEVSPQTGTARLALIYGFGGTTNVTKSEAPAPSWTGPYLGGGFGRNLNVSHYEAAIGPLGASLDGFGAAGFSGSAFAGYNFQVNKSVVVGAEVVGTLSTSKSRYLLDIGSVNAGFIDKDREWFSARMRSGYLVSPETMAYGYLGYTRVHSALETAGALTLLSGALDQKYNRNGLEFGAGVETWISQAVTLRVEYGVAALEKVDLLKSLPIAGTLSHRQSTGMVAVAYHF